MDKQLVLAENESPSEEDDQREPTPKVMFGSEKQGRPLMSPISPDPPPGGNLLPVEESLQVFVVDEHIESIDDIIMLPVEMPSAEDADTNAATAGDSPRPQCQSITQLAGSITSKTKLEGRLWYLAGAILNQILSIPTSAPITTAFNEDISIRAVFHGWTSVIERYSLDRGWQWLKELDERI